MSAFNSAQGPLDLGAVCSVLLLAENDRSLVRQSRVRAVEARNCIARLRSPCGSLIGGQSCAEFGDLFRFARGQIRRLVRIVLDVVELYGGRDISLHGDPVFFDQLPIARPNRPGREDDFITRTLGAFRDRCPGVDAIESQADAVVGAGQTGERREQIRDVQESIVLRPGRNATGPSHCRGDPDTALQERPLQAAVRAVSARFQLAAVVVQEHDQRLVEHTPPFERAHDLADRVVQGLHHGALSALVRGVRQMVELPDVSLWRLVRIVRGVECDQEKERTAAIVTLDQLARLVGQEKGRVAGFDHWTPVPVQILDLVPVPPGAEVPVVVDEPVVEAVVMVESALQRQAVRPPVPQVPLADQPGRVAGVAQGLADRPLVEEQSVVLRAIGIVRHARLPGVPAGEERGAGWSAHRLDVELRQLHPFVGDPVQMGRRHLRAAVETGLPPTHVVGEEDHDVGSWGCRIIRLGGQPARSARYGQCRESRQHRHAARPRAAA